MRGRLGPKLIDVAYRTAAGEQKTVRWWALEANLDDGFEPNDEIDGLRWASVDEAVRILTWDTDRTVMNSFLRESVRSSR